MDRSPLLDVQVVCTSQVPPAILIGTAVRKGDTLYEVHPKPGSAAVDSGASVVLDFNDAHSPLVQGTVEEVREGLLEIRVVRTQERDRREFPRVTSAVEVRYLVVPPTEDDAALATWIEKGITPSGVEWQRPGPLVDLSASGLALEVLPTCKSGDRLFVTLALQPDTPPWRGVARVVRVALLKEEELLERDPESRATHRMSLELTHVPDEARQAILERTIDHLHLPGE